MGRLLLVVAGIVSACSVVTLILFVILLMGVDPPPLGKHTGDEPPKGPIRRSSDDPSPFSNLTDTEEGFKGDYLDVDQIVDQIVSSSIAQLNNNTSDDVTELSNSILTRLRGSLLKNIKRAIPRMIQSEVEVDKLQTKINSDVPDQSVIRTDDVVAINITDVLGQPLVELKLYSYKSGKTTGGD